MSTNKRVLLVVNPISGGKDKTPIIDHITKRLEEEKKELRIYRTTGERDKEELREIIEDYEPHRILIVAGDGTIKLVAEILKSDAVPLGIFPAGSANGLAANLDLPSNTKELTDIALSDNFVLLDTIMINHELCIHISDIGLNAALIKNYEEGNIRGKLGYFIQTIPTLMKSNFPFQFKIDNKGTTLERQAVLLAIANARKYGTGSTINPHGSYDDGKFEVLVFKEVNFSEILKTFSENAELSKDFVEIFSASEVSIECDRNIPFQIDGEYRGEVRKVHAEISPIKIKIAVPQKKATF
ncbi:diacylglycerol/lipid kinase family protein [Salinimicrobium soli]|uniref:diacylglycerol/lipid kinase family protein n=1 Tax=Salinimicrobium soli TaxID=1254399 RepID=UPI003AACC53F